MDPSDLWRKQQADQRSSRYHKALRERDWEGAAHAASPDKKLEYAQQRLESGAEPSGSGISPPVGTPTPELEAELGALVDHFSTAILDVSTRVRYIQYAHAVVREAAPDARDKLDELRRRADALG